MNNLPQTYTPEEVASILKLNKNTVYDLINKGEIVAKKLGKVYRIPQASIEFVFSGLDYDLSQAEEIDKKQLPDIRTHLKKIRKELE